MPGSQDISPAAWRAAGLAVAAQCLGLVLGEVDLAERVVWVSDEHAEPGSLDVVVAAGYLARTQAGWGPGPPPPSPPSAPAWVAAACLVDEHIATVRRLASFLDEVSYLSRDQWDRYWAGELP